VKLLFDHHLSPTLVERLADLFPQSEHVWNVNLHSASDDAIWFHAREHEYTIVSKDADFSELSMQHGYPPKLIWLQVKNSSTDEIEALIRSRYHSIKELPTNMERGILVLFRKSTR
jgi:predicted nuclease of predicted toxin-antitoxin system